MICNNIGAGGGGGIAIRRRFPVEGHPSGDPESAQEVAGQTGGIGDCKDKRGGATAPTGLHGCQILYLHYL